MHILSAGGPLPRFEGFPVPSGPPPNVIPGPIQPQASGGPIRVPPLVPEKVAQYSALFEESGAQNGLLSGIALKQSFTCNPITDSTFPQAVLPSKYLNERNFLMRFLAGYGILQTRDRRASWA